MAGKLLNKLISGNIIDKDEAEIYRFGIEILSLKIMHYAACLLIAALLGEVVGFLIFLVIFLPLRKNGGGYHAKTKGACLAISCFMTVGIAFEIQWIPEFSGECIMYTAFIAVSDITIYMLAPLGNRSRELDEGERKYFKYKTCCFLMIANVLYIVTVIYGKREYIIPAVLAMTGEAVLLLLEKNRKKRNKNEKKV